MEPMSSLRNLPAVVRVFGTDHYDLVIALVECPPVGNLAAAAAIQAGSSVHIHHGRDKGHGCGSLNRRKNIPALAFLKICRLSCEAVCGDGHKAPFWRKEGFFIKGFYLIVFIEKEVQPDRAVGVGEGTAADIIRIVAVGQVDSRGPSDQACRIVKTGQSAGTCAYGTGKIDVVLHQRIQHALVVESAESAALQDNAAGSNDRACVTIGDFADIFICLNRVFFPSHLLCLTGLLVEVWIHLIGRFMDGRFRRTCIPDLINPVCHR